MMAADRRALIRMAWIAVFAGVLCASCERNEARDPDTLVRSVVEPVTLQLDPHLANDVASRAVVADIFEGLYRSDASGRPELAMADAVEVSEDDLTWTFSLRRAFWSDGEPVHAEDFVFGLQRALSNDLGAPDGPLLFVIEGAQAFAAGDPEAELGVEAFNDTTLVVRLAYVEPALPAILALPIAVPAPTHAMGTFDPAWMGPANVVVNGPFVPDVRAPSDDERPMPPLVLSANSLYRDATCFDGVAYTPVSSAARGEEALQGGQLDLHETIGLNGARGESLIDTALAPKGPVAALILSPNVQFPPFDDARVRQAMALAIDEARLAQLTPDGWASPLARLWLPGAQEDTEVGVDYREVAMVVRRQEATGQLRDAGFNEGRPLQFKLSYADTPMARDIAEAIVSDIEAVADWIAVDAVGVTPALHQADLAAGAYQIGLDVWFPGDPSRATMLQRFVPWAISRNATNWSDAEFTQLYRAGLNAADLGERTATFDRAEQRALNAAAAIPLLAISAQVGHADRLVGIDADTRHPVPSRTLCPALASDGDASGLRP